MQTQQAQSAPSPTPTAPPDGTSEQTRPVQKGPRPRHGIPAPRAPAPRAATPSRRPGTGHAHDRTGQMRAPLERRAARGDEAEMRGRPAGPMREGRSPRRVGPGAPRPGHRVQCAMCNVQRDAQCGMSIMLARPRGTDRGPAGGAEAHRVVGPGSGVHPEGLQVGRGGGHGTDSRLGVVRAMMDRQGLRSVGEEACLSVVDGLRGEAVDGGDGEVHLRRGWLVCKGGRGICDGVGRKGDAVRRGVRRVVVGLGGMEMPGTRSIFFEAGGKACWTTSVPVVGMVLQQCRYGE